MALPDTLRPGRLLRRGEPDILMRPFDEMRRMMQDFWLSPFVEPGAWSETFNPSVDVREEDDEVIVSAELPGIDQKDVDVEVTQDSVRIAGEKKHEAEKHERGYYRRESVYGSFNRVIDLPAPIDEAKAEAQFSKGVLTIKLPKSEQAKAKRRKVQVKSA
jgi:HSP20 family protein